jgi:hypothetical protein
MKSVSHTTSRRLTTGGKETLAAKMKTAKVGHQNQKMDRSERDDLFALLPKELKSIANPQTALPAIAKDAELTSKIEEAVRLVPTTHRLFLRDAREMSFLEPESVHLVLTSPPYWTLKKYHDNTAQLGSVADYEDFLIALDKVWQHCFYALVPGGRLICVVVDVCLSRRKNGGRHPLVADHPAQQRLVKTGGRLIKHAGLLLIAAGGESPEAEALWQYAEDRGAYVATDAPFSQGAVIPSFERASDCEAAIRSGISINAHALAATADHF